MGRDPIVIVIDLPLSDDVTSARSEASLGSVSSVSHARRVPACDHGHHSTVSACVWV
jgi:hypothetical protein